nr:epididymal secretory protein 4-like [Anolis sagrei ordinatus]XP_060613675.1 epididymal secretory protein 4-like [Anolis sagrei ordinatus]
MAKGSLCPIALLLWGLPFLAFAYDVPVMKDVDVAKLAGKWYPLIFIKTDSNPKPTYAYIIEPISDGGLSVNMQIPKNQACIVKKIPMRKTSPGVFTFPNGTGTIMDTDYKTYIFSHFVIGNTNLMELSGRDKKVPKEVKEKFKALVKKVGLKPRHRIELQEKEGLKEGLGLAQRAKPQAAENAANRKVGGLSPSWGP